MQIDLITVLLWMGIPSAVTGFCFWLIQKKITRRDAERDRRDAERDKRDEARKKYELLLIKGNGAAIALGEATAHAIQDGQCNGQMTCALEYAQKVKHEQKDFLSERGVENLF